MKENRDAIDGLIVNLYGEWNIPYNLDGAHTFAGKKLVDENGQEWDGANLIINGEATPSVGGFIRLGSTGNYHLLSKETDEKGRLQIYGPFYYAGYFFEDVTPVVRENESFAYINKDGAIAFYADEAVNKPVRSVYDYEGGLSIFMTTEGLFGALDTKGKVAIQPIYNQLEYIGSGLWAGVDPAKNQGLKQHEWKKDVLDASGKLLFTFDSSEMDYENPRNWDDCYCYSGDYGIFYKGSSDWAILNKKGEAVLTADKVSPNLSYKLTGVHNNGLFVTRHDEFKQGMINVEGKSFSYHTAHTIEWLNKELMLAYGNKKYEINSHEKVLPLCSVESPGIIVRLTDDSFALINGRRCKIVTPEGEEKATIITSGDRDDIKHTFRRDIAPMYSQVKEGETPQQMREVPRANGYKRVIILSPDIRTAGLMLNVESVRYYSYGSENHRHEFDLYGRMTEYESAPVSDKEIERDEQGRIISITQTSEGIMDGEVTTTHTGYTYDDKGRVQSEIHSSDYATWTLKHEYEGDTDLIIRTKMESESSGNSVREYIYTRIDTRGNWTRRTVEETFEMEGMGKQEYVEERRINYHRSNKY